MAALRAQPADRSREVIGGDRGNPKRRFALGLLARRGRAGTKRRTALGVERRLGDAPV